MTSLGRSLKTSDLFVAALENEGVEYIFAVPGRLTIHHAAATPLTKISRNPLPR